jgi:hypothetical protein
MYRIVIVCPGVSGHLGTEAAADIQKHFDAHRSHHKNVNCSFTAGELTLIAENDFDPNGLALQDEFSDCISAFLSENPMGSDLIIKSVTEI